MGQTTLFSGPARPGRDPEKIRAALEHFTGTENWYRHGLARNLFFTDGVKYLADSAGAYWLIDVIASWQTRAAVRAEPFQVWTLARSERWTESRQEWLVTCDDGNDNIVCRQTIPFSDFPLPEGIKLYCEEGEYRVILLPREH